jgi:hypothetical protein
LERLLGIGRVAEVYEVRRDGARGFSQRFALKRMLPELARDREFVQVFAARAELEAGLSHPNLVQLIDFGETRGELYSVLELVDGITLEVLLEFFLPSRAGVPLRPALHIVRSVLRALRFLHDVADERGAKRGLVHGDVTPASVLLGRLGQVKLSELGLRGAVSGSAAERLFALRGRSAYDAPETRALVRGGARADVYSLARLMTELLVGRARAARLDAELAHPAIPDDLRPLIAAALAEEPERRPSGALFDTALGAFVDAEQLGFSDAELAAWIAATRARRVQSGVRARVRTPPPPRPEQTPPSANPTSRRSAPTVRPGLIPKASAAPDAAVNAGELRAPLAPLTRDAEPCWSRELGRVEIPMVLFGIIRRSETGVLELVVDGVEKRLGFRDGQLLFVDSNDASERLGERLVRSGVVAPEDVNQALAFAAARGAQGRMRIGQAFVAMARLSASRLREELLAQRADRFVELGSWESCRATYTKAGSARDPLLRALPVRGADAPALSPEESVELAADLVNEGFDDVEIALRLAPFHASPLARRDWIEDVGILVGDPDQGLALERAPGALTLNSLVASLAAEGVSRESVLRAVFLGLVAGALWMPGWPSRPSVPAPAAAPPPGELEPSEFPEAELATLENPSETYFCPDAKLPRR